MHLVLAPADGVRSAVLRWASPWLKSLYADRHRRVLWLGVASVTLAFVTTGLAPLWSLALGPVLLGVPHLVSDVRYLVVRPGLHRVPWLLVLAGAPLLATSFGAGPQVGLLAVLPMLLAGGLDLSWWKLVLALVAWLALLGAAFVDDYAFQLAFVHAHNLVAVVVWWAVSPRRASMAWVPALTVLGAALILLGALDPVVTLAGGWTAPLTQTSFTEFVESIAPTLDGTFAARLVLSFCFLQAVHYAVWLRLMPDDERPRPAPRTFRASWEALEEDFGRPALLVAVLLSLCIAVWGAVSLVQARQGYLHLAAFHGYLELAVLARWFVRGKR